MSGAALETRGLGVTFGGIRANDQVDITVRPGSVVAVIGPNGAGKTTLLNAICRLVPSTGDVLIDGRSVAGRRPYELSSEGLGRSFQHPHMVNTESVLQNVMAGTYSVAGYSLAQQLFARRHVGRRERALEERALQLLFTVSLGELADQPVNSLPYGPSKLIDILRAVVAARRLVVLDEPTSGLDGGERLVVRDLIRSLNREDGISVLLVEHHMELVRAVADHVIALNSGSVMLAGPPAELFASADFKALMVGGGRPASQLRNGDV